MKKYSIYIMLASALILGSCSDFLDRDPLSQASENTFWQTEADADGNFLISAFGQRSVRAGFQQKQEEN